jgi:hypothetical protein
MQRYESRVAEGSLAGQLFFSSGAKIKYTTFKKLLPQRCTKLALWLVLCNVGTKPVVYFIFREALILSLTPHAKPYYCVSNGSKRN